MVTRFNQDTYMTTIRQFFRLLAPCVGLVLFTSCSTSGSSAKSSVNVELVGTETIRYSGELVPLADFPKRLKKSGYPLGQTVRLQIGVDTPPQVMYTVKNTIQQGGYAVIMHRPARSYAGPPVSSGRSGGKSQTLEKQRIFSGAKP